MADSVGIVILAAGKGTRLKMDVAKALCPLRGKVLVDHVLENLEKFASAIEIEADMTMVVGHKKEEVQSCVEKNWPEVSFAWQREQKGTAHALQCYFEQQAKAKDKTFTLVVCADTPLISEKEYMALQAGLEEDRAIDAVAAVFETSNPAGYGRIVAGDEGFEIVEEKDATEEQRKIKTVNSGLYLFKTSHILNHLKEVSNSNKSGEFYLPDLFKKRFRVKPVFFEDPSCFLGINNLAQLEQAEGVLNRKKVLNLQLNGARFINSSSCYIEDPVKVGQGTVVYPNVVMEGNVEIGENCVIEAGVVVKNSKIGDGSIILANSYLEEAVVEAQVKIGPMARIRPGSRLEKGCKIGNFVETKNAKLGKKVSVSHLSYVGDAEIGENTNLGCGFITCNYDGAQKHKTIIGKDCFIGSDSQMIAPIAIGDEVFVASGSTINQDIPSGGFGIARQRQTTKEGMAKKFLKKKS